MRLSRLLPLLSLVLVAGVLAGPAAPTSAPRPADKPFGIDRRIPWTTSRVIGSPNPPPPYRVRRAFPKLKVPCPIGVAHEPGTDNLLLIHQLWPWGGAGRILRIKDDDATDQSELLLKVDGIAYGVAFHPNFLKNGYLFVGSNGPYEGKAKTTRVIRYTIDRKPPHKIVPGSAKMIIEWPSDGHNGGDLAFGNDGLLYITSGDGTSDSDTNLTGQDLSKLLAKVLRIDVDHPAPGKTYAVPPDNPFVGVKGVRPETWAYGFRNPWRLHYDRPTGDLWVGQNGQDLWEQVYLVKKGANYGWSVMEGSHPFYPSRKAGPTPFSLPIAEHHHSEFRSLTGGVVYRGKKLPDLRGVYLYGDWSTGKIWGIRHKDGKPTWHQELASTRLQITGFGIDSRGELLVADHGGGYYRLEPTPKGGKPPKFPTRLSETGLFLSVKEHRPQPGLIPYDVNAALWSDGAAKERFLALPGTAQIDYTSWRGWNCPDGTVLVKTFSLDLEAGNPRSRRRTETRLLTRQQGEWAGYSYLWNDEQTDATLVGAAGLDRRFTIRDPQAPGGRRQQTWHYPSRAECMVCHSRAANWVLGLTTLQMNRDYDYGSVRDNQLRTLEHLGVFRVAETAHVEEIKDRLRRFRDLVGHGLGESLGVLAERLPAAPPLARNLVGDVRGMLSAPWQRFGQGAYRPVQWLEERVRQRGRFTTVLTKTPAEYDRLVDPYDPRQDLEARARSYLHANCAQCHVEAGGGNALMELEFTQPRAKMRTIGAKPQHHTFDVPGAKLIDPGHPERSVLYLRVGRRGQGQMPPLATSEIDRAAVKLLRDWIKQMKP
jgi:glucose/arabinose dehydrogenase/mono/diheme cytochrome c family protein